MLLMLEVTPVAGLHHCEVIIDALLNTNWFFV